MASLKRERQRARKAAAELEELPLDLSGLIICDRCGLLQPFTSAFESGHEFIVPCAGPLGLPCDGETAVWADDFASESVRSQE